MARKILITGVSGGIGRGIARKFLGSGFEVLGVGRSTTSPVDLLSHQGFSYVRLDISKYEDVQKFFRSPDAGDIQCIVNCAGILLLKNSEYTGRSGWKRTLDTNLTGSFHIAKFGGEYFRSNNEKGMIILIGSRWGNSGTEKDCAYATSKAGLTGLVKSFQKENLETGIRYVLVSPGSVLTGMSRSVDPDVADNILGVGDIADLVMYLTKTPPGVIFDEISIKAFPYDFINP